MALDPLQKLHTELDSVRVEYERYFMGLEKRQPQARAAQIAQKIRRFDSGRDSVLRFRHRNLVQRLTILEQYWGRIQRAIEAGTYSRQVAQADFRQARRKTEVETPAAPTQSASKKAPAKSAGAKKTKSKASSKSRARTRQVAAEASAFLSEVASGRKAGEPKVAMRGRSRRSGADDPPEQP